MRKRVCIIGAGASGLIAARHVLSRSSDGLESVVYEESSVLGGCWVYNESPGGHGSIYRDLKANFPTELMALPDFPFPKSQSGAFLWHWEILEYLKSYARHFSLEKHIRFRHMGRNS